MKLGKLILQYRERNDLSQREFARRCDLSNSLISIIEKGINPQTGKEVSPDLETYARIARAMGITMQTLFEQLGDDATVHLLTFQAGPDDDPDPDYVQDDEDGILLQDGDYERLEALHQDPRLCLLFDRSRKMQPSDVETMLAVAASILKERDGE